MIIALVANGFIGEYDKILPSINRCPIVIAVDGGLTHCHKMGICPEAIVGDLDSAPEDLLAYYKHVKIERFPREKDETDLELAINLASRYNPEQILIFGGLGYRTDHSLANLHLMRRFSSRYVVFETESQITFKVEEQVEISTSPDQVISFIPIGEAARRVNSQGLKWELKNASLGKDFLSISNVCLSDKVLISIEEGDLICCLSK